MHIWINIIPVDDRFYTIKKGGSSDILGPAAFFLLLISSFGRAWCFQTRPNQCHTQNIGQRL